MDWDIRTFVYVANAAGTLALALYLWLRRRHDRNSERIGELADKVEHHQRELESLRLSNSHFLQRLERLEHEMGSHLERYGVLCQSLGRMEGRIEGIGNALTLIQDHLIAK